MKKKSMAILLAAAMLLQNTGMMQAAEITVDPAADAAATAGLDEAAASVENDSDAIIADDGTDPDEVYEDGSEAAGYDAA